MDYRGVCGPVACYFARLARRGSAPAAYAPAPTARQAATPLLGPRLRVAWNWNRLPYPHVLFSLCSFNTHVMFPLNTRGAQASESPLTTVVAAGSAALPTLLKLAAVMEKGGQVRGGGGVSRRAARK